jgi:hypothetical protein
LKFSENNFFRIFLLHLRLPLFTPFIPSPLKHRIVTFYIRNGTDLKTQTFHCVRTALTRTRRQRRLLLSTPRSCRRAGAMRHLPPVCITASTAHCFATSPDTQSTKVVISHRPRALQTHCNYLHVCTVHQQYQSTFYFHNDAHNYKITGILKHLKFRRSLRHVSFHAGTIIREPFFVLS